MNVLFTFFKVRKKVCPYLEKIKFLCKFMYSERDDAKNVVTRRCIKTNEFYLYQSGKEICHCGLRGEERCNHQQSFTISSRQGHIAVKVLALRSKNTESSFASNHKGHVKFTNIVLFH